MGLRIVLSAILLTLMTPSIAQADEIKPVLGIKVNPLGGIASALPIQAELFLLENRFSVIAGGSLIRSRSGSGDSYYATDGFTLSPELRHYFGQPLERQGRTYAGLWYSYEEYNNATNDRLGNSVTAGILGRGGGIIFGNQWFFSNGFVVDIFFGPGYMQFTTSENYDLNVSKGGFLVSLTGPKPSGTRVRLGLTVGLAF